jgi:hypothetical protein
VLHALDPAGLFRPAAQGEHWDAPAAEKVPTGHVAQSVMSVAPVVARKVPAAQLVQVATFLYWPAEQVCAVPLENREHNTRRKSVRHRNLINCKNKTKQ